MKHKVKFELFIPERSLLERKLRSMHCLQNYCSLDSHQMNSNKSIICISTKKKTKTKQNKQTKQLYLCFAFQRREYWRSFSSHDFEIIDITIIIKYNCHFASDTDSIKHKIIFYFFWTWVQWISFHYNRVFYALFFSIFWESVCSHECVVRKTKFAVLPFPFNENIYFSCVELAWLFILGKPFGRLLAILFLSQK